MKSLLVDALRQKDQGQEGEGLSDSGSFATSRADLAATTVEEPRSSEAAGDLELMATGAFIVANDEGLRKASAAEADIASGLEADILGDDDDVQFSETIAAETTRLIVDEAIAPVRDSLTPMPRVARFVPIVCVALAAFAALAWFGILQLELQEERSPLGSSASVLRSQTMASENGITATAPRFRYLGLDGQPLDDEVWQ